MSDVESIVKTTMGEIESLLNTKTVVGEPIVVNGKTLIPLVSVAFGFGAGSGTGRMSARQNQEGTGGGTGGGAGIRPIAVIVSDDSGVRIEPVKVGFSAALEKMAEKMASMIMKRGEQEQESEGSQTPGKTSGEGTTA